MGNLISRWLCGLLLLGASSQGLNAVQLIFQNNSDVDVTNPVLRYGTLAQYETGGAGQGGVSTWTGTATSGGGTLSITISDAAYKDSQPSTYTYRWGRSPGTTEVPWNNINTDVHDETELGIVTFIFGGETESCAQTMTLHNAGLRMVRGYWTLNDVVVFTEDIAPGRDATHTVTPDGCTGVTITAYTVTLMLNEDFELVPTTNIWDTIIDPTEAADTEVDMWWLHPDLPQPDPLAVGNILDGVANHPGPPIGFSTASATDTPRAVQEGFTGLSIINQQGDAQMIELLSKIQENTLGTMTNVQGVLVPVEDMQSASGASVGWSNAVNDAAGDVTFSSGISGSVPSMLVTIGVHSVDLNPFHNSSILAVAGGIRNFIYWAANLAFALWCFKVVRGLVTPLLLAPQAAAASAIPAASSASALVMAGIIVAILGAALISFMAFITVSGQFAAAMATPFGGGIIGNAAVFFDTICPVVQLLSLVTAAFVFQIAAVALVSGAALAVRFFVGCLAGLLLQTADAATVDFFNGTGTNVTVGAVVVPPGRQTFELESATYSVSDGSTSQSLILPVGGAIVVKVLCYLSSGSVAITQEDIDLVEGFWLGMVSAAVLWSMGFMIVLVRKAVRGGGE